MTLGPCLRLSGAIALIAVVLVPPGAVARISPVQVRASNLTCQLRWTKDGTLHGRIKDVRVLPGGEAWAVGFTGNAPTAAFVAHREAGRWIRQAEGRGDLSSLSGRSRTALWAVGTVRTTRLLRLEAARWRPVGVPDLEGRPLAARTSPWFSGFLTDPPRVYFWNGARLQDARAPQAAVAITGTDSGHAWLAGLVTIRAWRHGSWSAPTLRLRSTDGNTSWALIDAASATDVWALDTTLSANGTSAHWDGHQWRTYPYPTRYGEPLDLVAVSPNGAWALFGDDLLDWDGTAWAPLPLPKSPPAPGRARGPFAPVAIDSDAPNSIWLATSTQVIGHLPVISTIFHGTCT
jgi:hypothetical protein